MNKNISTYILFVILAFYTHYNHCFAQTTLPIDLETVLKLAGTDNLQIKQLQHRKALAEAEHLAAKEWLVPNLYIGGTLHKLTGRAMNGNGAFFTDVDRENFWGGLGINAEWNLGEGMYRSLAAKQKMKTIGYENQAIRNQAILSAIHAFFDLQAEQVKYHTLQELAKQSENITQQIEVQVLAGVLYKSELLLAQSNQKHALVAIKQSEINLHKQSATLVNALNIQGNVQLLVTDSILVPLALLESSKEYELSDIYSKRPEFQQIQSQLKSLEEEQKTVGKGLLFPTIRLQAQDAMFGDVFSPLENTFEINGGVMWNIPLGHFFFGGKKKEYQAKTAMQQVALEQVQNRVSNEISSANSELSLASEQLELAKEGLALAQEALNQSIARQEVRTAKPYEVFQAQEYFMRAKLDYIESIKNYNQSQYNLYVALGNDL